MKTVSGKVLIGADGAERVAVHTVSGKVEIRLPAATKPVDAAAFGQRAHPVRSRTGDDGEISVASVSGAIRVSSA